MGSETRLGKIQGISLLYLVNIYDLVNINKSIFFILNFSFFIYNLSTTL